MSKELIDHLFQHGDGKFLGYRRDYGFSLIENKLAEKPSTEAVSFEEGGDWVSFDTVRRHRGPSHEGKRVHAIRFSDGSIWDAENGWRQPKDMPGEPEDGEARP